MSADLTYMLHRAEPLTTRERLALVASLSWPSIMAQISSIVMEYIDAMMVGSLGASASASIGLVTTSTWLLWGLGGALCTGYSVQVAHLVGARSDDKAREVFIQSLIGLFVLGLLTGGIGMSISGMLPIWLGGNDAINRGASNYFRIVSAFMPMCYLTFLCSSMLRCSGNMKIPGIMNVLMCVLDVIFNYFLIFDSHTLLGMEIPGFGLGVPGAAFGTGLAEMVTGGFLFWYITRRSDKLNLRRFNIKLRISIDTLKRALSISSPIAAERAMMSGAQILSTVIVAPLGTAAIAANAFAITAEGLCYMPGYGVSDAATTLVGQSLGASRRDLARNFGRTSIILGIVVMSIMAVVVWLCAPLMMEMFTPALDVRSIGTSALRIEMYAEPMFGASIVAYGVMVGAGYTIVPACINLGCIWGVRLTLAALLAPIMGLDGVWLAMCIELCVRGVVFLIVFAKGRWMRKANIMPEPEIEEIDNREHPYVV